MGLSQINKAVSSKVADSCVESYPMQWRWLQPRCMVAMHPAMAKDRYMLQWLQGEWGQERGKSPKQESKPLVQSTEVSWRRRQRGWGGCGLGGSRRDGCGGHPGPFPFLVAPLCHLPHKWQHQQPHWICIFLMRHSLLIEVSDILLDSLVAHFHCTISHCLSPWFFFSFILWLF